MGKVSKNNIVAIVVTYNRKKLLLENIGNLLSQKYNKFDIMIIDNNSNDGTYESIKQYIEDKKIFYYNTKKNLGGAGGFNYGLKKAYEMGYDYMWIMDDDTIPTTDALAELMIADKKINHRYGFLASVVLWEDGNPCIMNKQKINKDWYNHSNELKNGLLKINHSSFASFFTTKEVIKKVGYPIKDFFIWGDDIEYSNRISKKYENYLVGKSLVYHKINNNVGSNIAIDDEKRISRYKFAYRNEMFTARKDGFKMLARQFVKINYHIFRVIKYSKSKKIKRILLIIGSSFKGLFFNPKIEYVGDK